MASSSRTDDILTLCGILLRRGGVWYNVGSEHSQPLRMCEFKLKAPVEVRYCAVAEPIPGTKTFRPVRPFQLRVTHNGATMFMVKWDDRGRRKKTKDERRQRNWEFLVRREATLSDAGSRA